MSTTYLFDFEHAIVDNHDNEVLYTVTADVWPGSPAITLGHPDDRAPATPPEPEIKTVRDAVDVEVLFTDWPGLGLCLADLEEAALEHYYPMVRE